MVVEVAAVKSSMDNSKAVGREVVPVKLQNLDIHHDPTVLPDLHQVIIRVGTKKRHLKGGGPR